MLSADPTPLQVRIRPRGAKRDIDYVAETLHLGEATLVQSPDMLRVDAPPSRLWPPGVVLEHQILGAALNVAGQRQIAEAVNEETTTRCQDTACLGDSGILIKPPPALTGAHQVK